MMLHLITRKVDALEGQGRIILWLACKHIVSMTATYVYAQPASFLEMVRTATHFECPYCIEAPKSKSAQQLWKEAGEP